MSSELCESERLFYDSDNLPKYYGVYLPELVLLADRDPKYYSDVKEYIKMHPSKIHLQHVKISDNIVGDTGLTMACKLNNLELVELLVELLVESKSLINITNREKMSPLMLAVNSPESKIEIVRTLINAGADLHEKNIYGDTALLLACYQKNVEIIKLLICAGSDVNTTNKYNINCLMIGIDLPIEGIKYLISAGANVNNSDYIGRIPLTFAICRNSQAFEILLDAGADPNHTTCSSKSVLMIACKYVNRKAIELLLKAEVDVNEIDDKNMSALMYLIKFATDPNIIDLLNMLISISNVYFLDNDNNSAYDLYKKSNIILDEHHENILRGSVRTNKTKSANK